MPQDRLENASFSLAADAIRSESAAAAAIANYRARAAKLHALAVETLDPEIRRHLLATAAQFDRLADYAAVSGSTTHAA
jgi:hypothetical protein